MNGGNMNDLIERLEARYFPYKFHIRESKGYYVFSISLGFNDWEKTKISIRKDYADKNHDRVVDELRFAVHSYEESL